jgi:hypothetical protein
MGLPSTLDETSVRRVIESWYLAFQGSDSAALTGLVAFPFRLAAGGKLTVLATETEFTAWWQAYVSEIRRDGVVAGGEILRMQVSAISNAAALVRLHSARLDSRGNRVAMVTTGFVVYEAQSVWKVGDSISNAVMDEAGDLGGPVDGG